MGKLPPCRKQGIVQTLVIHYTDGSTLEVPYFDEVEAESFLSLEKDSIESYELKDY